jgi:hypothetical protein
VITQQSIDEITYSIEQIQSLFQDLVIGGLRTATQQRLESIQSMRDEFERIGAVHIAEQLTQLCEALNNDSPEMASILMRTQAQVRLLERILTVEIAESALTRALNTHG